MKKFTLSLLALTAICAAVVPATAQQDAYTRARENAIRQGQAIKARQAEETRRHNENVNRPTTTIRSTGSGTGQMKSVPSQAVSGRVRASSAK